jgi:hypothetical protein
MSTVRTLSSFNARLLRQAAPRAFRTNNFSTSTARMTAISDAIKQDHRELEEYYNNILNAKDHDQQTRWQNQFVWELARHSLAEELVVYPAMEKHVKGGKEMADKDRAEHQVVRDNPDINLVYNITHVLLCEQVKNKLNEFQQMSASDSNFIPKIKSLWADLEQHIKEEESHDLPSLDSALATEDSQSMAASFERTKKFVPTRSHPSAPNKPPFETVVGLMTAPIDKLADMLRKFPDDRDKP